MKMFGSVILILVIAVSIILPVTLSSVRVSAKADENGKDVARAIGDEGLVLLKNENSALPLKKGEKIALLGEGQYLRLYSAEDFKTDEDTLKLLNSSTHTTLGVQHGYVPWGAGSSRSLGEGGLEAKIDPLDAFKAAHESGEIVLYEGLSNGYVNALKSSNSTATYKEFVPTDNDYEKASANADTAIVFIRRWNGECVDSKPESWDLTENETLMLKNATKYFDKVVVVLNTPAPIETDWAKDEVNGIKVDALIFAGYGGMQGGLPIADVILGRVNPSGKLVTTYAKDLYDYPTTETFINDKNSQQYTEDIFLGYRYFETFDPQYKKVNYEFGFGLSYTQFDISYSDFKAEGTVMTFKATVKNTGNAKGKETVQLYLKAPQGKLGKAAKVLCGFEKTALLEPGQSDTLNFSVDLKEFASFDDLGKTGKKAAYVLEAGEYVLLAGNSVRNVSEVGKTSVNALTVVEQLKNETQTTLKERLLANGTLESLREEVKEEVKEETVTKNEKVVILVEGEDFDYSSETASGAASTESFSGFLFEDGEWVEYSGETANHTWRGKELYYVITVDHADDYTFSVRAAGHGGVAKPVEITAGFSKKDGDYVDAFSVTGTATWEKSTYNAFEDLAATGTVKLEKGTYYVRLKTVNSPNVDLFTLTSVNKHEFTVTEKRTAAKSATSNAGTAQKYMLADVIKGKATLEQVAAGMSDEELATFFISHNGARVGAGESVRLNYGLQLLTPYDGPSGIGSVGTSFPCETIVACTWNPLLTEAMGLVIGKECYDNNLDIWLAPGMNLHRNPIAGRNSEYYSEDPYISGIMGTAATKAAQSMGVSVCIKHFVCNEKETNKLACDSQVSERALREIYLKPFEMTVKNGRAHGVMSSYNLVNGIPASANKGILTNILRGEWGFEGYVSGDWNNNKDHVAEINAGNTVREPASYCDIDVVLKAIKDGKISRETLEAGAVDVMYMILRAKGFYEMHSKNDCTEHDFDEFGRCKKCYSPDYDKHENIKTVVTALLNGRTAQNGEANVENNSNVAPKRSFPWLVVTLCAVGVVGLGAGVPFIIKKKKGKKNED